MASITLKALEDTLTSTLNRIQSYQEQIPAIQKELNVWQQKLNTLLAAMASYNATQVSLVKPHQNILDGKVSYYTAQLSSIQGALSEALDQKILDQEAIRDYKISNMSASEVGEFLEVETKAAIASQESQQALDLKAGLVKYKKTLIVGAIVVLFIIVAVVLFKFAKNKLKKKA